MPKQNAMNLSRNLSLVLGGCTSLAYLAGSVIPLWSMDKFGRRVSLMVSAAGLCLCFVMTSILLSIGTAPCAYAATVFVFIFQLFLGIGYLPVPWFVAAYLGRDCMSLLTTNKVLPF
jgi:MFS family permease